MDSILSDEPSIHTLPDGNASEKRAEPSSEPVAEPVETSEASETPAEKVEAQGQKPATVTVADDDDDDKDDPVDQSLEGLRKALTAVRGDKRKARKQWREAEKRAEEAAKSAAETARRLAALEGQLAVYQQMGARPQAPAEVPKPEQLPDFFGDPDAHLTAREKRIRDEIREARESMKAETFKRDADRSERRLRREYQDYDEAKTAFMRAVLDERGQIRDPRLWSLVTDDPEPAEVVYTEGKKLLRGGKPESEAKMEAEIAELKAQLASQSGRSVASVEQPRSAAQPKPVPKPSIASARGTGNGVPKAYAGPRSTREIFGD